MCNEIRALAVCVGLSLHLSLSLCTRAGIDFRDPTIDFWVGECDADDPIWEPRQSDDPLFHHNFCYQTDKSWPVPHNARLLRITVTHFRSGRSLLSLGCSHALFDGIGLMTCAVCVCRFPLRDVAGAFVPGSWIVGQQKCEAMNGKHPIGTDER